MTTPNTTSTYTPPAQVADQNLEDIGETIFVYGDHAHVQREINNKVSGYFKVPTIKLVAKPTLRWTGSPFPIGMWRTILGFFEHQYGIEKSESQVRLFYKDDETTNGTGFWRAWAFPQKSASSMTTQECPEHPEFQNQMNAIHDEGFYQFGTVHHHCAAGAFQSGTDKTDETSVPGIHITVGKIATAEYDLHSRFTLTIPGKFSEDGSSVVRQAVTGFFDIELGDFFSIPEGMVGEGFPESMKAELIKHLMKKPSMDLIDQTQVEVWMKNRIKEPPKVYQPPGTHTNHSTPRAGVQRSHYPALPGVSANGTQPGQFFRNGTGVGGDSVVGGLPPTKHADIEKILAQAEKAIKETPGSEEPIDASAIVAATRVEAIITSLTSFTRHFRVSRADVLDSLSRPVRTDRDKTVVGFLGENILDAYKVTEGQFMKLLYDEIRSCQALAKNPPETTAGEPHGKPDWHVMAP